jgi:hypothetical protein
VEEEKAEERQGRKWVMRGGGRTNSFCPLLLCLSAIVVLLDRL